MSGKTFEKELVLIRNPRVGGKGWVAKVNLGTEGIEFLPRIEGDRAAATFEFEEGELYIVAEDRSSWKNSYQRYSLMVAKDGDLDEIAYIAFDNRRREIWAETEELEKALKRAYMSATKNKVTTALIAVAKAYAEANGVVERTKEEKVIGEVMEVAQRYGVSLDELIAILEAGKEKRRDEE